MSLHFGQVVRHGSIGPLGTGNNIIFKAVGRIVHTYASWSCSGQKPHWALGHSRIVPIDELSHDGLCHACIAFWNVTVHHKSCLARISSQIFHYLFLTTIGLGWLDGSSSELSQIDQFEYWKFGSTVEFGKNLNSTLLSHYSTRATLRLLRNVFIMRSLVGAAMLVFKKRSRCRRLNHCRQPPPPAASAQIFREFVGNTAEKWSNARTTKIEQQPMVIRRVKSLARSYGLLPLNKSS